MNIWNFFTKEENIITKTIVNKVTEIELLQNELDITHQKIIEQNKEYKNKIQKLEKNIKNHNEQILNLVDKITKTEALLDEHIKYNIHYRNIINNLLQKKLI